MGGRDCAGVPGGKAAAGAPGSRGRWGEGSGARAGGGGTGVHNGWMGLPSGMVTLLFTDIEGGRRLWEADPEAMAEASARHDRIVREQIEAAGGRVVKRAQYAEPVGQA